MGKKVRGNGAARIDSTASMRAAASDSLLVQRGQFASMAGLTFEDERDLYRALGYKRQLTTRDYIDRFSRGGIAARIVKAPAKATWRAGAELIEDENLKTQTEFEAAWEEMDLRLRAWSIFRRADILAGLGRYSVVVIGAPGDPASPIPSIVKPEDIAYLTPYGEDEATFSQSDLVTDTSSPRWNQPEYYTIKTEKTMKVHWSRIIHVAEGALTCNLYGEPRLRAVWNYLDDLDKVIGGGSEAFWLRAHPGMQIDVDPALRMSAADEQALSAEVDEYTHGLRRTIRTRGVSLQQLAMSVAPIGPNAEAIIDVIAATTEIPQRILMGSERGNLASEQDSDNWQERVQERRTDFAEPQVVRPFVDLMIKVGALPEVDHYEVRWPDVRDLSLAERSQIAVRLATVNHRVGVPVIKPELILDRILGFPAEDAPPPPAPENNQSAPPPPLPTAGPRRVPGANAR